MRKLPAAVALFMIISLFTACASGNIGNGTSPSQKPQASGSPSSASVTAAPQTPSTPKASESALSSAPAKPSPSAAPSSAPSYSKTPSPASGDAGPKVTNLKAETAKNQKLELAILRAVTFTKEKDITSTRYYYNKIDLNGDGTDEVFVQLIGPVTSGTGGDTGLIFTQKDGGYALVQKMTLVRNPILVCDTVTKGWHDLVMTVSGGGAKAQRMRLIFDGTSYPNPGDGTPLAADEKVGGTAIISNDIDQESKDGKGLYLSAGE